MNKEQKKFMWRQLFDGVEFLNNSFKMLLFEQIKVRK